MKPRHVCLNTWKLLILVLAFDPSLLQADVTVTQHIKQGGSSPTKSWERKLRIKGLKMSIETSSRNELYLSIYNLETGKRFHLNPQRKEAFVMDLKVLSGNLKARVLPAKLVRVIRSTGKRSEVLGAGCDEYTFDLQAPNVAASVQLGGSVLHESGTVCVSQDIPEGVQFTNFVLEAKKRGYTAAASVCSPTFSAIGLYFYGEQPNVMVLSAITQSAYEGGSTFGLDTSVQTTTDVTGISSELIPDERFQVPADWKIKEDRTPPSGPYRLLPEK